MYLFFFKFFPIQLITEYWSEFPVLSSRSLLVICFIYGRVYMLVPNSHFIPPPPCSSLNGHLGRFCLNSASVYVRVHSFVWTYLFIYLKYVHLGVDLFYVY